MLYLTMTKTFTDLIDSAPAIIRRKLEQLKFLRERPDFHPEKSAFEHIRIVTERLIQTENPDLVLSGILHDISKFDTVKENPKTGFPTSPGHDQAAHDLIKTNVQVTAFIVNNGGDPDRVTNICLNHMRFHQLKDMRDTKREAQIETWKEQGVFRDLEIFGDADNMLEEFRIEKFLEPSEK